MKKMHKLKKNHEFSMVFDKGSSYANRQFVLYVLKKPAQSEYRVGVTVSRKLGNAVTRNRMKRLLREVLKELDDFLDPKKDYVIIARKPALEMEYEELKKSFKHVLRKSGSRSF
ncbi:ribonuclease P protein component [Sinobaca qinghaiensis]|uniref:Ribonuclease P protein component n=1 Tax=Sinobaca qinghaiensis TaxID=342944 RepID=A0A419UTZ5_9BACL|nr:ribonuclease P protein component [Sinobaca qinghaiensis]